MTWSTTAYLFGFVVGIASLIIRKHKTKIAATGLSILLITLCARLLTTGSGREMKLYVATKESSRLINRIFDEADLAIIGSMALRWTRMGSDPEVKDLASVMKDAYARMSKDQGSTPSPVLATYLGQQNSSAYDTLEFGKPENAKGTVIFLHGWLGNFTLFCWEMWQSSAKSQMATVCPSTRWKGDWWSDDGQNTIKKTLLDLKNRGVKQIYLAGLSNGAVGALKFANDNPSEISGLILISGAKEQAAPTNIPILVLQGKNDRRFSSVATREFSKKIKARYIELEGGHFVMLTRESETIAAISTWLKEPKNPQ